MQATQDGEHALTRWYTLGWGTLMKKAEEDKVTRDHGKSYNGPAKRGLLLSHNILTTSFDITSIYSYVLYNDYQYS